MTLRAEKLHWSWEGGRVGRGVGARDRSAAALRISRRFELRKPIKELCAIVPKLSAKLAEENSAWPKLENADVEHPATESILALSLLVRGNSAFNCHLIRRDYLEELTWRALYRP